MKFIKYICFLFVLLLFLTFKISQQELRNSTKYALKCGYNFKNLEISCVDQKRTRLRKACFKIKGLREKYDMPLFSFYEEKSLRLFYDIGFFSLYKSKKVRGIDSCNFFKTITNIGSEIDKKYKKMTLLDKAKLMYCELSSLWIYGENGSKDVRFFNKIEVDGYELICNAEMMDIFIYPIVAVLEIYGSAHWVLLLANGGYTYEMYDGPLETSEMYLKHELLLYGLLDYHLGYVYLFNRFGVKYERNDGCKVSLKGLTYEDNLLFRGVPEYREFNVSLLARKNSTKTIPSK